MKKIDREMKAVLRDGDDRFSEVSLVPVEIKQLSSYNA